MALNKDQRQQLVADLAKQQRLEGIDAIKANMIKKSQFKNLQRTLNEIRREEEELNEATKKKEFAVIRNEEIENEERLARELKRVKEKEICEIKRRQLLRQSAPELRELESKLKAAYIRKEVAIQIQEKEAARLEQKIRLKQANEVQVAESMKEEEAKMQLSLKEMHEKVKYRQELHDQMIYNEQSKRSQYEEFLREKKMLDDIVQRLHEEDEREIEEKMCRMRRTKQEIEAFKEAQEVWRRNKKELLEEENRRIQEYLLFKAREAKANKEEQGRKESARARLCDEIAKANYLEEVKKREREEVIQQLCEEEEKAKMEVRRKQEVEKQIRQRIETREALLEQLTNQNELHRKEAEDQQRYREELWKKISEDERLELLSNENKRRKMMQLRRDVEDMCKERRQRRAAEIQQQIRMLEQEKKEEDRRRQIIQEERLKIIQEHASNLIGYLPKGILNEDDVPLIKDEALRKGIGMIK